MDDVPCNTCTDFKCMKKGFSCRLFDAIEGALLLHNVTDGAILSVNNKAAELFGYTKEKFATMTVADITNSNIPTSMIDALALIDLAANGDPQVFEWHAQHSSGRLFWVEVNLRVVRAGDYRSVVALVYDITHRKKSEIHKHKLQAQLSNMQKMEAIGTLAGGVAHDFNNILTVIASNAALLMMDADFQNNIASVHLKSILHQVDVAKELTGALLGYARKGRYVLEVTNVNRLIRDTIGAFGRTRKEVIVNLDLEEDLNNVKVDRTQLEQVLLNLFLNAADAMSPHGGNLTISTYNATDTEMGREVFQPVEGDYVAIVVSDNGCGMTPEIIEQIFIPFFTTKHKTKGTGLGLASVYGAVKAHNGYVDVTSTASKGSAFYVYLPAIIDTDEYEEEVKLTINIDCAGKTILITDDEETVLGATKDILKSLKFKVFTALNGEQAIEIYKGNKDKIDLVMLDLVMPGLGGSLTFDQLRGINPEVKILLCSGYSMDGVAAEIMARGCNGFLQKPYRIKQLSKAIKEILNGG